LHFPPSPSTIFPINPFWFETRKGLCVCVWGRSWERKMGTSVQVTPLCGVYNENPLSYLVSIDGFNFLVDCGWNDHFDPSLLQPLSRSFSFSHCFNFFFFMLRGTRTRKKKNNVFFFLCGVGLWLWMTMELCFRHVCGE